MKVVLLALLAICCVGAAPCSYPLTSTCDACVETVGVFPNCPVRDSSTNHLYLLVSDLVSWDSARSAANQKGGYLASISTQAEFNFVQSYFNGSDYWVAGTDFNGQGTWLWTTGDELHKIFYTVGLGAVSGMYHNFAPSTAPTTRAAKALIVSASGAWVTQAKSFTAKYLVEISNVVFQDPHQTYPYNPATAHYYQLVESTTGLTWNDANSKATSSSYAGRQGYLVTITTPEEHNFIVQNFLHYNDYVYIGASDASSEGTWKWIQDNTVFWTSSSGCANFCLWANTEPNGGYLENWGYWRLLTGWDANIGWVDYRQNNDVFAYIVEY